MHNRLVKGRWANIIKVRAVAAAATGCLEEAINIQTYKHQEDVKDSDKTEWEPPSDLTVEEIILKTFKKELPFTITRYDTKYAKALDYRWSKEYGIGGWPNCILILNNELVLTQFRTKVDRRAMVHATGLYLILDDGNCGGINKKFEKNYRLEKPELSQEIYFINESGFLTKSQIYPDIKQEVILWADKLREEIREL